MRFMRAERIEINNTPHTTSLSAQAMRHILADRARARLSRKRSANRFLDETYDLVGRDSMPTRSSRSSELSMNSGSNRPASLAWSNCTIWAVYTLEQAAEVLNISRRQAQRD